MATSYKMSASSSSHGTGSKHLGAYFDEVAATMGDFQAFENYAQSDLDHLILGKKQNTILHVHLDSPNERSKEFVEKVLEQCPRLLGKINNDGDAPLHIAAKKGYLEIVKLFIVEAKKPIHRDLERGEEEADSIRRMLRLKNKQKETALHLAINNGGDYRHVLVVQEILKHEDPNFTYTANVSGETPLYLAIRTNRYNIAIEILNKFESPDFRGPNGKTVFHSAALYRSVSERLLGLLLSKVGSFVNQGDESGWTPLHCAAYFDNLRVVRKILTKDQHSAFATDKDRCRTALHIASCRGNVCTMKEIIKKCPECCEMSDVRGWNFLHYAVISKSEAAVKAIIKHPKLEYLINERDVKGYTPFHLLLVSPPSSSLVSLIHDKFVVSSEFWEYDFHSYHFMGRTFFRGHHEDKYKLEKLREWMKDLGSGPIGKKIEVATKNWQKDERYQESVIPEFEKGKESHLVAAALVATVTFTAAFTLPGGYISDENDLNLKMGSPILSRNVAFQAFVITDTIAMVLSTSSVLIHFVMVLLGYKNRYYWLIRSAYWFAAVSMTAMVVSFVTGTYAVLAPDSKGLAIATLLIGLTCFLHRAYCSTRLFFHLLIHHTVFENNSSPFIRIAKSLTQSAKSVPQYLSCMSWPQEAQKKTKEDDGKT